MTSVLISVGCHIETLQKHHDRSSLRIINKKSAPTISEKYFSNTEKLETSLNSYTSIYTSCHINLHVMLVLALLLGVNVSIQL